MAEFDYVGNSYPWQYRLNCPCCHDHWTHQQDIEVFDHMGGEDGPTFRYKPGDAIAYPTLDNPSPRRDATRINFLCEAGHLFHMDILQHKGETFVTFTCDDSLGGSK